MNHCLLCGTELSIREINFGLCQKCRKINIPPLSICHNCGQWLSYPGEVCSSECPSGNYLDSVNSLFPYSGDIPELISLWKFRENRRLTLYFAHEMNLLLDKFSADYILVPVPPSVGKIKRKGWDQILDLSKALQKISKRRISYCLEKQTETSMKSLNRDERKSKKDNLFKIKSTPPLKVILIDDILTTGTTLIGCAMKLKSSGTESCHALTIARD